MHQFQSNNGGHDRGRHREWRISNLPQFFTRALPDFDKTKALLNLSMQFLKITYNEVYLGKI